MGKLLTPADVHAETGLSIAKSRELMRTGRIRSRNIGSGGREQWRCTEMALEAYLAGGDVSASVQSNVPTPISGKSDPALTLYQGTWADRKREKRRAARQ